MTKKLVFISFFLLLIISSIFIGLVNVPPFDISTWTSRQHLVLLASRLPRTISLLIAGASVSVSGLVMQNLMQNKFVSPNTVGTMDSAKLGIVFVMIFLPNATSLTKMSMAFVFALLGTSLFLLMSRYIMSKSSIMLPLVGIMFGNIIGSIANFFAFKYQLVQNVTSWLQGNFSIVMRGSYELLYLSIPLFILIYLFAYQFTIIAAGQEMSTNLGISYQKMRLFGVGIIALTSSIVLVSVGNIPFLGIIVPNLVTLKFGDQMKKNLPLTAYFGAAFLIICDIIGRTIISPYEISASLIVGVLGSVCFIALLLKEGRRQAK
ncbi:MAG: iron chelate uptake ABC transporter family permease subunit [Lactococcus sp.]|jgi:iron complex transport system permease protein|uniref:ABC transporter permease n=1 Tax=Pseudolactococcus carnosus TaxID=2749961 RepID=UPI0008128482|nr:MULTISPECIES: iron chelate uptake ABC transporter family permease subunit [Lactococcus]SCA91832.1 ABC transporter permease [Lactococcus piscium]MBR6896120.1 iron chelate uptake ABC transporter family permease subunit [Lactococcus sp.]MCJ1968781.1 iron chelate uptake ABC transporter family permease subunit [Lactococcus carnosus]MCJ1971015.1 iron chelate uptake ABC transporter family permease subunit [Lactococcus carnosus]MCJ1972863.1 iron chelate uptake ABC transporter family permease subuni